MDVIAGSTSKDVETVKIEEDLLKERKEKLVNFFIKGQGWVIIVLIIAVILGVYIRSLPMTDHNGRPGLWDITTNTWTLGPDLDPWLFLRGAKIIVEEGSLPAIDHMRNVPLGFDNSIESKLLPYMIAWTYKILRLIGMDINVEFAGVIFPVIMFGLTIISFFLFVREIFVRRTKKSILRANIIALIASFFMIVIPIFLSRTIAGIPEKESAAFFFMFFSFYLFLKAWKSKETKDAVMYGILAGISTGLMGLIWGGVIYVFISIGLATFIAFILGKVKNKHILTYGLWVIISFFIMLFFSGRFSFFGMLTSLSSGFAILTLFILLIHFFIWNTKISKIKIIRDVKLSRTIISLIISVIALGLISLIFLGPSFIVEKAKAIHQTIFKPIFGRWNITVAENRQPNFQEWSGNFGPYFKNIPLMFWLFFIGSIVLFKKMLLRFRKKDSWVLTGFFIFFLFGIIFSRYSGGSVFNGDNFISKAFYYLAAILFAGSVIYYYLKYEKRGDDSFRKIRFEYILLFSLFILTLFTVRGAVRLIMVLGPIASIFVGFLIVEFGDRFLKTKDSMLKIIVGCVLILILISSIYSFSVFYKSVKGQAYSFVPSSYTIQWQKAMNWVRTETSEDAVFSHWWDYGYWVQSIGNRATIGDGGNAIVYWNYLMGRLVLTGDNQDDALEFLFNHNVTHLLIDSSDIGKYTAFSSIGSDINFDRYSFISTFLLDESQTRETNNKTILVFPGGIGLDEDLVIDVDGNEVFLPGSSAAIGAVLIPFKDLESGSEYQQPFIIVVYQGQQYNVDLRYLYLNGKLLDFETGIEATAFVFPRLEANGGQVSLNNMGAVFYLSPRLMRGMLAQVYIMDDPLNNFPNFKLAHTESALVLDDLRNQGMNLPDIVYFQGVRGPIKIWEVEYTGKEQIKEEYLERDETKYLDWLL